MYINKTLLKNISVLSLIDYLQLKYQCNLIIGFYVHKIQDS
jgi:hypothetical protein